MEPISPLDKIILSVALSALFWLAGTVSGGFCNPICIRESTINAQSSMLFADGNGLGMGTWPAAGQRSH